MSMNDDEFDSMVRALMNLSPKDREKLALVMAVSVISDPRAADPLECGVSEGVDRRGIPSCIVTARGRILCEPLLEFAKAMGGCVMSYAKATGTPALQRAQDFTGGSDAGNP